MVKLGRLDRVEACDVWETKQLTLRREKEIGV